LSHRNLLSRAGPRDQRCLRSAHRGLASSETYGGSDRYAVSRRAAL